MLRFCVIVECIEMCVCILSHCIGYCTWAGHKYAVIKRVIKRDWVTEGVSEWEKWCQVMSNFKMIELIY